MKQCSTDGEADGAPERVTSTDPSPEGEHGCRMDADFVTSFSLVESGTKCLHGGLSSRGEQHSRGVRIRQCFLRGEGL